MSIPDRSVVDGHNDLPWAMRRVGYDFDAVDVAHSQPQLHTDLPRLRAGGVGAQFWSVFVPATLTGHAAVTATCEQIDAVYCMIERYPDDFSLVTHADGLRRVLDEGRRIGSLLGAEGVQARTFHSAALRQLQYFWPQAVGGSIPDLVTHKARLIAEAAGSMRLSSDRAAIRDLSGEIERARALRIELAADYLVMAAWLAYMKSRLLLPPDPEAEGPSAEDMAAHLAFQLERLGAMREAAARLMARDRLGHQRFARGAPETVTRKRRVEWQAGLIDLMRAYARLKTRDEFRPFALDRRDIYTMEQALDRMRGLIGFAGGWTDLADFLPDGWDASAARRRSATAATFAASLELAKQGQLQIRQEGTFAPIAIRRRTR